MRDSIPENEVPFLPKDHEAMLPAHHDHQSGHSNRWLIVTVALISALVSVAGTAIMHSFLPISFIASSRTPLRQELLPSLDVPPLGNVLRTYVNGQAFYDRNMNASREAWMSLFPPGMGYVSMDNIKDAGDIPQIIQNMSTDGSGRFCVAAFHQLHCLFLMYNDFRRATSGEITHIDGHTLHCYDYLRESIICAADSSLEPFRSRFDGGTEGNGVDGFGTVHQCRDFKQLFEWSEKFRYGEGHDAEKFEG
ncbi:Oxidase ustYa [Cladobotryum mycophilum]|uniref:Oxidase ustYa n=1 Tax=Cladobotryum mycophilum TaxID=491253 RepID=A0ABR0SCP1_9HYPO